MHFDQTTWPTAKTKMYLWKDKVHIFHLAPWDFELAHLLGHSDLMKILAHLGDGKKWVIRPYLLAYPWEEAAVKTPFLGFSDSAVDWYLVGE